MRLYVLTYFIYVVLNRKEFFFGDQPLHSEPTKSAEADKELLLPPQRSGKPFGAQNCPPEVAPHPSSAIDEYPANVIELT